MLIYLQAIESTGDRAKFEAIYQAYRDFMYQVAYARLRHEQDAEDAVHDVFVKIAENIGRIEPVSARTKRLVVTMVDNRVTDILRVRGRHPELSYLDEVLPHPASEQDDEGLLASCILRLPQQQRMVIWLKYHYGYSLREIADILGISFVWAQKVDQRAKKKLEALYAEGGGTL